MKMQVTRKFTFDAAHHLTKYYGKCERPHGHTYRFEMTVEGRVQKNGLVIDFVLLKKIVEDEVLSKLDHRDLNDLFKNPSAEHIAQWIWNRLKNFSKLAQKQIRSKEYLTNIQKYFDSSNRRGKPILPPVKGLKLVEIKLCESPNTCVILK